MSRARRGQTLLIVLWAMGMITLAVGSLVAWATHELRLGAFPVRQLEASAALEAGVAQAMAHLRLDDPAVDALNACGLMAFEGTEALALERVAAGRGTFSIGQPAEVPWCPGVIDEQSKLSLNHAGLGALQQLIAALAAEADAAALAAAIIDWRDEEPGAVCAAAQPPCRNGLFESVEELRLVPGVSAEVFEALRPYVTVFGSGAVNANTASVLVLNALGLDGPALALQRAEAPFTEENPPPDGLAAASTVFTVPVEAAVDGLPPQRLEAVVDRTDRILAWRRFTP